MAESEALYDINNLKYEGFSRLSLVESGGVFKQNPADQNTYASNTGTEMIITLQSNQDYVYGPNCYLRMDVSVDGTTGAADTGVGFKNSPATALFSRFLLEDKSGAEVERIESLNKAVRACLPWKHGKDYDGTKEMAGQAPISGNDPANAPFVLNSLATPATGVPRRVCVPLWYFSGLFGEETLIPSMLVSGMRWRLSLAQAAEAISQITGVDNAAGGSIVYTIQDPVIMLDTYSLGLSVRDNLLEASQGPNGLPFTYETLYYQEGTSTQNAYTLQLNKAVARAEKIWTQTQADQAADIKGDSLGARPLGLFQYQCRIGDYYAPLQVLQLGQDPTAAGVQRNCAELYANNLQNSHGHVSGMCYGSGLGDPYRPVSVSVAEFGQAANAISENGKSCAIVQNVNQSPHVASSGIAINNSRTAEQRLRWVDTANKVINSWLQYCKMASVFPSRTIIAQ